MPSPAWIPCAAALAVGGLPGGAAAEITVLLVEADHLAALANSPEAGIPLVQDFEAFALGTFLGPQLQVQGIDFSSAAPVVVLPQAYGSAPRGTRLAVVGFAPQQGAILTLSFDEPQLGVSLWLVDVGEPLQVQTALGGNPASEATVIVGPEDTAGGHFVGLWFGGFVDELTLVGGAAEDGFGVDDLGVAMLGSVDNDGDGSSELDGDCDDADPEIGPGQPDGADGCDGVDDDCDGAIDEDGDLDGDGAPGCAGDCDDADATVFPGAPEICDGLDNDCDGVIDDVPDGDGDGVGPCEGDCDDGDPAAYPGAVEICDGIDNDCDGLTDESPDADGDGWTVCEGDCDDTDPTVYPGSGCDEGDDDDAADDDDAGDDDDAADDDDAGDDDDAADDDDAGDDDDSAVAALRGIAGGGFGCSASGGGGPSGAGWLLVGLLALLRRRRAAFAVAALVVVAAAPALAQEVVRDPDQGLNTVRFRPAVTPSGGALAEGVHPGAPWDIDVSVWTAFARREVVFTEDGEVGDPVVAARLTGLLQAGVTIGPRVRVTLDLPAALAQTGTHPTTGQALAKGGVGDLRVSPHVMILDPSRKWLGIGVSTPITFPTGRVDALLGDPTPTIEPRVSLEKRMRWERAPLLNLGVTLNAGWRFRPRVQLLDLDTAGELTFGLGLRWDPIPRVRVGAEIVGAIGRGANARYGEWLSHVRVVVDRAQRFELLGGAGLGLGRGVGTPEGRLFVGVRMHLPARAARATPAIATTDPDLEYEYGVADDGPPLPGSQGAGWGLRLVGRGVTIDTRLLFAHDSALLRREARPLLEEIANWLLAHERAGALEVAGHADASGGDEYNLRLSTARARAVATYLTRLGVPEERVRTVGHGERRPAASSAAGQDPRAPHRRVEFRLVPETDPGVSTSSPPTARR